MRALAAVPFLLFFASGFCGLLYQVVWLRLAFRSFGVITPVLSVVISVFMLGLALGSWAGGRWVSSAARKKAPIFYYAAIELLIGLGAFAVPTLFSVAEGWLLGFGEMGSTGYLAVSALLIGAAMLPWCVLMGFTFPFMMAWLRGVPGAWSTSFSYLYLANVVGAMCGALVTAFVLIELFGFSSTLALAGAVNFAIAAASLALGRAFAFDPARAALPQEAPRGLEAGRESPAFLAVVLFTTGLATTGLEIAWTRAFTPVLQTTVYAFAALLSVYLLATWIGSFIYRRDLARASVRPNARLFAWLALFAFLPVVVNDPRINSDKFVLLATIVPFSAALGYLTPRIIDQYSLGAPDKAGRAYAVNIIGCILGPLLASYLLLPLVGAKVTMALLAAPFVVFLYIYAGQLFERPLVGAVFSAAAPALLLASLFASISYEERFGPLRFSDKGMVKRDHTASVVSYGSGMDRMLYVNGIGITGLTPITKMMAHWPLALLEHRPSSALVICFGMGTTYRSLMSWPIEVTAVELVPSVRDSFGYFHADAGRLMADPRGTVVVDDGRRFLRRTSATFDVITIDPPPPVEAAGSSLLYSREFYELAKTRLKEGGVLHQWFPGGEDAVFRGIARSIVEAFPYVRAYDSIEGWGVHFIASMRPVDTPAVDVLLARMPEAARADMVEWNRGQTPADLLESMGQYTLDARRFVRPGDAALTDDAPLNEYFMLRRTVLAR